MEALPLELRQAICEHLFPPIDRVNAVTAPRSSKVERTAIYNLRLTSKRVNEATELVFRKVIEDVPTQCTEQSLRYLDSLIHLNGDGSQITSLTFSSCKLSFTEQKTLREVNRIAAERREWMEKYLSMYLLGIFVSTPNLRHLVCCFETVRGSEVLNFGGGGLFALERIAEEQVPDPVQFIFEVLEEKNLHDTLETFNTFVTSWVCFPAETSIRRREYFTLPSLKHMTLSPAYHTCSPVLIHCANITSWKIILDSHCVFLDFVPIIHITPRVMMDIVQGIPGAIANALPIDLRRHRPSDAEAAEIRNRRICTITANGCNISARIFVNCVRALLKRVGTIPSLTICNMNIRMELSDRVRSFKDEGEIHDLVFEDVKARFTDDFRPQRNGDLECLSKRSRIFKCLCDRARKVSVIYEGKVRILEDNEWRRLGADGNTL